MFIVSLTDVIALNHKLKEKNLSYRVHLRDTCGKQCFWAEVESECGSEGKETEVKEVIRTFFAEKGANVKYLSGGLEFIIE